MGSYDGSPSLCRLIRDRIERSPSHRISFAEFMELALYEPDHGYYTAQASQLGFAGDFVTATHLGSAFGELLSEQFVEMWHRLDCPPSFQLVEMGPGQGQLAATILAYVQRQYPRFAAALHYLLIETSPALQSIQQHRLQPWQGQLTWCSLQDVPANSVVGCIFANELVDAFPVHRVTVTEAGLQELYVTLSQEAEHLFDSEVGPVSTPAIEHYFQAAGITFTCPPYSVGYTTEVNLAAATWMAQVAQVLRRGYVLTIDYGYTAERYYHPRRTQGTLQCYYQQGYHDNPFIWVGQQDVTAHVDFTALERQGEQSGLMTLGTTPQGLFLMALGVGDRLNQLAQLSGTDGKTITEAIQQRDVLHQLINPMGLGQFIVLVQGKGLDPTKLQLQGLTVPNGA